MVGEGCKVVTITNWRRDLHTFSFFFHLFFSFFSLKIWGLILKWMFFVKNGVVWGGTHGWGEIGTFGMSWTQTRSWHVMMAMAWVSTGGPSGRQPGAIFQLQGGRGGHPLTVPQYTKDHLNSIIFLPPDWPGNDTTQMILHILAHRQRVSSSSVRADQI